MRTKTTRERIIESLQWTGWEAKENVPGDWATIYFFANLRKCYCGYNKSECANHCYEQGAWYQLILRGEDTIEHAIEDLVDGVLPMLEDKVWITSRPLNIWQRILYKFWRFEFRHIYGEKRIEFVDWEPIKDPSFKPLPKQ